MHLHIESLQFIGQFWTAFTAPKPVFDLAKTKRFRAITQYSSRDYIPHNPPSQTSLSRSIHTKFHQSKIPAVTIKQMTSDVDRWWHHIYSKEYLTFSCLHTASQLSFIASWLQNNVPVRISVYFIHSFIYCALRDCGAISFSVLLSAQRHFS